MRTPIDFVQTRKGWKCVTCGRVFTPSSRSRHVLDGHPIYDPCICGKAPAYIRGRCRDCWRTVARPVNVTEREGGSK